MPESYVQCDYLQQSPICKVTFTFLCDMNLPYNYLCIMSMGYITVNMGLLDQLCCCCYPCNVYMWLLGIVVIIVHINDSIKTLWPAFISLMPVSTSVNVLVLGMGLLYCYITSASYLSLLCPNTWLKIGYWSIDGQFWVTSWSYVLSMLF